MFGQVAVARRQVTKPDRREVIESQPTKIQRTDREQGEVVFGLGADLRVAAELLEQVSAQIGPARGGIPPQRQVVSQRAARTVDEVVAFENPDPLLPEGGGAPELEVAAKGGAADVEVASQ